MPKALNGGMDAATIVQCGMILSCQFLRVSVAQMALTVDEARLPPPARLPPAKMPPGRCRSMFAVGMVGTRCRGKDAMAGSSRQRCLQDCRGNDAAGKDAAAWAVAVVAASGVRPRLRPDGEETSSTTPLFMSRLYPQYIDE